MTTRLNLAVRGVLISRADKLCVLWEEVWMQDPSDLFCSLLRIGVISGLASRAGGGCERIAGRAVSCLGSREDRG